MLVWKAWFDRPSSQPLDDKTKVMLLKHLDDEGFSYESCPVVRDDKNTNSFEKFWEAMLKDAGRKGETPKVMLLAWIDSFGCDATAGDLTVQAFKKVLLTTSDASEGARLCAEVMKVRVVETEHEESTSALCVWFIYAGELLVDKESLASLQAMLRAASSMSSQGRAGFTKVNIQSIPRYYEVHKRGSAFLTLSQSLADPTGRKWLTHTLAVTENLTAYGLYGAAARWMRFVAISQQKFPFDVRSQLCYARHFFFGECVGRGLPTDVGLESIEATRQASSGSVAAAAMELAFQEQCAPVGPWAMSQPQLPPGLPAGAPPGAAVGQQLTVWQDAAVEAAVAKALASRSGTYVEPPAPPPPITELSCPCGGMHAPSSCTKIREGLAALKKQSDSAYAAKRKAALAAAAAPPDA